MWLFCTIIGFSSKRETFECKTKALKAFSLWNCLKVDIQKPIKNDKFQDIHQSSTWNTTSGMASAASAGATESNITLNFCRRCEVSISSVFFCQKSLMFQYKSLVNITKDLKKTSVRKKTTWKKRTTSVRNMLRLSGHYLACSGWRVVCFWFCCITRYE